MTTSKGVSLEHSNIANAESGKTFVQEQQAFNYAVDVERPQSQEIGYVIFKLVKKRRGRVWIDGICDDVVNPKTGKSERIYYLQGASSIWESDLEPILKDKESYRRRRRDLPFEDSILRIRTDRQNQLEFARRTLHNVGKRRTGTGKFDFYEYDPQQEQKDRLQKQTFKLKVIITVNEMPVEEMRKLAAFLGVVFYDELGQLKGDDGVRAELLVKADTQPDIVNTHIGSKEVLVSWLVRRAIVENKIDLQGQSGNAIWANGKGFIAKIPSTEKPLPYLTQLAMTNSDEGRKFKEQLESVIT